MKIKKHTPNFLTMINLALGFLAILYAALGEFGASAFLIIAAVVFDFLDGRLARILKSESRFGEELDSLADLISFGVAPAALLYLSFQSALLLVISVLFVLGAGYRLARFNVFKDEIKGFIGMPITVNGLIFPILYFAQASLNLSAIVMVVALVLMVSTYHFKKVI